MFTCGPAFWGGSAASGDPYWSSVIYLARFNGTDGGAVPVDSDESSYEQSTAFAAVVLSGSSPIEGTTSVNFPAANITEHVGFSPIGAEGTLGTGDWTIEGFVDAAASQVRSYPTLFALMPQFGPIWQAGNVVLHMSHIGDAAWTNKPTFWVYNFNSAAPLLIGTSDLRGAGPRHWSVTRSGNDWYLGINGVIEDSATWSGSVNSGALKRYFGGSDNTSADGLTGKIDMVRETVGVGRYTGSYIVPTTYPIG